MSKYKPGNGTSTGGPEKTADKSLSRIRAAALIGALVGAIGAVSFTFYAGRNNDSYVLKMLFLGWVLSPFAILVLAVRFMKRLTTRIRTILYYMILVLSVVSLVIYGYAALTPPGQKPAFVFVVVPLGSWILIFVVGIFIKLISRNRE